MRSIIATTAFAFASLLSYQTAYGALVINFSQVGPDVVITASGTVDLTGLTKDSDGYLGGATSDVFSAVGDQAFIRSLNTGNDIYYLPFVPALFNNAIAYTPGVSAGQNFGVFSDTLFGFAAIFVPNGFTNGSLNGSLTLPGVDLSSLGVDAFSGSWGGGANQSMSITSSTSPIPEPTTYMAIAGFAGLGLFIWRRRCVRSGV